MIRCLLLLLLLTGTASRPMPGFAAPPASGPTYFSPLALAFRPDGRVLFVSLHGANMVLALDPGTGRPVARIAVDDGPSGLDVSRDGRTLYVACTRANTLVAIDALRAVAVARYRVGFEPVGVCVNPAGRPVYVANRISNDVTVIDHDFRREIARVPVARMPSHLAVTPDGRRLLVANQLSAMPATDPKTTAVVSVIDTATLQVVEEKKAPETMHVLQQIIVSPDGKHAYVSHLRPNFNVTTSQLIQGWIQTNALTVIPLTGKDPPATVLLDNVNSGAGNPYGLALSRDARTLYVSHTGTHQISLVDLPTMHRRLKETPATALGDVAASLGFLWGRRQAAITRVSCGGAGPKGIAISPVDGSLFVANHLTDTITVLDGRTGRLKASIPLQPPRPITEERRGEFLFASALHCFQQWLSCTSCHPDVRVDGVNWDLLNDGVTNPKNAKSLVGSWQTPPVMSLGVRADMETAVEKGFLFIQFHNVSKEDKDAVSAFLRSVPFIPSPHHRDEKGELDEQARRGEALFTKAGCITCHPPPLYTDKQMHDVGTASERDVRVVVEDLEGASGEARPAAKAQATTAFDTPTLLEMYRTGPYLHDGRSATLKEVLTSHNLDDRHGTTSKLTPAEVADLEAFLMAL